MNWLKGLGKSAWIAIGIFFAAMAVAAAQRQKGVADKWREKAIDIEAGNVVRGIKTVKAANAQAALHDNLSDERTEKAVARITQIGAKNQPIADILDGWRK